MKRIKHICLFLFATLMMSPTPALAKMYKWVDEKGKTHFTDNRMNIPPQYRTPEKKRVALGGGFPLEILGDWKIAFTCTVAKKTKAELDDVFDEMAASLISR